MTGRLVLLDALFLAVSGAFWILLTIPARYLWGDATAVCSGTALVLCVVPTLGTLAASRWAMECSPDLQMIVILGGTGLRMAVVLLGALAAASWVSFVQGRQDFWIWVAIYYFFTLILEKFLVLRSGSRRGPEETKLPV